MDVTEKEVTEATTIVAILHSAMTGGCRCGWKAPGLSEGENSERKFPGHFGQMVWQRLGTAECYVCKGTGRTERVEVDR